MANPELEFTTPGIDLAPAIAPYLSMINSAGDIGGYAVIAWAMDGTIEMRTNMPDTELRELLEHVMPGA